MTKLDALKSLCKIQDYILSQDNSKYSDIQKDEALRTIADLLAKIELVRE